MTSGASFHFEQFELDPARRRLARSGEPVAVSDRQLDILLLLVARAGQIIGKDDLVQAGWKDVAVSDNSLEQAISSLRRIVGAHCIETMPRRGYRFGVTVERRAARQSDAALDALLAPHRAFLEGRAALETLDGGRVAQARQVFEEVLATTPEHASPHIGLASACAMQFEMTRADAAPDVEALAASARHAREACRLDPSSGEAWATLGFVLERTGNRVDAIAAAKRAVVLEPDNWRHHFRLSIVSWGDERLRAAHRTLALLPDFPLAHWLAATVHVARQADREAERELSAGLRSDAGQVKFGSVALHWLLGLILLARGDDAGAMKEFEQELAAEHGGHLYARECCANTWYAIGAMRLQQNRISEAGDAFQQAIQRVARHPMAQVALASIAPRDRAAASSSQPGDSRLSSQTLSVEAGMARAAQLVLSGCDADGAALVDRALREAPAGSAGWVLPIEPLLRAHARPDVWARPLALLRDRAA
jgi:DNA-binding winged helix-turn-helix (wHTH) protein